MQDTHRSLLVELHRDRADSCPFFSLSSNKRRLLLMVLSFWKHHDRFCGPLSRLGRRGISVEKLFGSRLQFVEQTGGGSTSQGSEASTLAGVRAPALSLPLWPPCAVRHSPAGAGPPRLFVCPELPVWPQGSRPTTGASRGMGARIGRPQ